MKKEIIVILLLMMIPFAFAEDTKIDKAYSCLEGKVGACSSLTSLEENVFSLLALSYKSDTQASCKSALLAKSNNQVCWPKSACKLRDTALSAIALQYINSDTAGTEAWLLNQTKSPSDLIWYLEIESSEATTCSVKYDESNSTSQTVRVSADKKVSISGSGNCLSSANSGYWLQISSSCSNKKFKVSCDKTFLTALLYKKSGLNSDIWHISQETKSASANGVTETQVTSLCFKQNNECDYEGSLWAALALQKNNDVQKFLPYLIALAPDYPKTNPNAFLYILTGSTTGEEYLANLRELQYPAGYWDLSSSYGKFYDTALSLRSLWGVTDDNAKEWLLSAQADNGCWQNSIRDTAFILYAIAPKNPASVSPSNPSCENSGKYCYSANECLSNNGQLLDNYACSDTLKRCCSAQIQLQTCAQQSGEICSSDEECSGSLVTASDASRCCKSGECTQAQESTCEENNHNCRSVCEDNEQVNNEYSCTSDQVCCSPKTKSKSYLWIWILVILIILVGLAILFRDRIKVFIFKFKNRGKSGPVKPTRPPFPPAVPNFQRPMTRPVLRQPVQQARPVQKKSKTDEELEETLKKLKEMSK